MSDKKTPKNTSKGKRIKTDRAPAERVKTAKGRTVSSTRWLQRQLNDPYIQKSQIDGYRSRAAYKIKEIDDKLEFFKPGITVVDLGAAPGGWAQVALERRVKKVIGMDLLPIDPLSGAIFFEMDFTSDEALISLDQALDGAKPDIVMSDLAPNTIGHKQTDHLRIMALVELAYDFAIKTLKPDGIFIAKVFQGGAQSDLVGQAKRDFKTVRHIKPPSSRQDSSETFFIATGFRKELFLNKK